MWKPLLDDNYLKGITFFNEMKQVYFSTLTKENEKYKDKEILTMIIVASIGVVLIAILNVYYYLDEFYK